MEQKIKTNKGRTIKKSFYEVEAPLTATKVSLYGGSINEFEGRVITIDLTKSLRGRSLELKMKVKNDNGKLKAVPIVANLAGSFIRRSMRRGIDYVEDSFKTSCRDALIVVKPFLITRRRVSRAVRNNLRVNARNFIEAYFKTRTAKELFSDIIAGKLQKGMAFKLKKVYPLAMSEIRAFEIIGEKPLEEIKGEDKEVIVDSGILEIEEDSEEMKKEGTANDETVLDVKKAGRKSKVSKD